MQIGNEPSPHHHGILVTQRPQPLFSNLTTGAQLIESIVTNSRLQRVLHNGGFYPLLAEHLTNTRRCLSSPKSGRCLRMRHLAIGQHARCRESIKRLADEAFIWLMPTQSTLEFPTRLAAAREGINGAIRNVCYRGFAG